MATATFNGAIIAQSDDTVMVEGNHYFPRSAVDDDYLHTTEATSFCPWKGQASYFDVSVDGQTLAGAAWCYPEPKDAAEEIRGRLAFWRGVEVRD